MSDILDRAEQLVQVGDEVQAIDIIYDYVDSGMYAGAFDVLNEMFKTANVRALGASVAIGLLTAANWAQSKLPCYSDLYARVKAMLIADDAKTEDEAVLILKGLEPRGLNPDGVFPPSILFGSLKATGA